METNDTIGARLRLERKRLGCGMEQFADAVGVTRQTQSKYEKDKRHPDTLYLKRFAELGGDILFVVTGVVTPLPQATDESANPSLGSMPENSVREPGMGTAVLNEEQQAWLGLFMGLPQDERECFRVIGQSLADAYSSKGGDAD